MEFHNMKCAVQEIRNTYRFSLENFINTDNVKIIKLTTQDNYSHNTTHTTLQDTYYKTHTTTLNYKTTTTTRLIL